MATPEERLQKLHIGVLRRILTDRDSTQALKDRVLAELGRRGLDRHGNWL